jgi:hypothetical protein
MQDRRAASKHENDKFYLNDRKPARKADDGHDRCDTSGDTNQQRPGNPGSCPVRLTNSDIGARSREETLQFMFQRYACAIALVTHEDASLFSKLKAMFEIETVMGGVLFTVAPILVAVKLAPAIPALLIAISCAALFVSFGYGRSIDEGLNCLAAHKSRIVAIEDELRQPHL